MVIGVAKDVSDLRLKLGPKFTVSWVGVVELCGKVELDVGMQ